MKCAVCGRDATAKTTPDRFNAISRVAGRIDVCELHYAYSVKGDSEWW